MYPVSAVLTAVSTKPGNKTAQHSLVGGKTSVPAIHNWTAKDMQ